MSESVNLTVTGMKCGGCETNITTKLSALAGVIAVQAAHQQNSVVVEYDPQAISLDEIEDTITDVGFNVE